MGMFNNFEILKALDECMDFGQIQVKEGRCLSAGPTPPAMTITRQKLPQSGC